MSSLIRAAGLHGYEALSRSVGLNVEAELQRVGLSLAQLGDADALLPYAAMIQLLEHSAQESRCADFGLRLSRMQDLGILGPVSVVVRHSKTLGDALQLGSRYLFVQSPSLHFTVVPVQGQPENVDLSFSINMPDVPPCAQALELSLGVIAQSVRLLGQGRVRPTLAQLPHARIGPLRNYTTTFDCECRFERLLTALRIPTASLAEPLAEHNPMLQRLAQSYLDQNFVSGTSFVARPGPDAGAASARHGTDLTGQYRICTGPASAYVTASTQERGHTLRRHRRRDTAGTIASPVQPSAIATHGPGGGDAWLFRTGGIDAQLPTLVRRFAVRTATPCAERIDLSDPFNGRRMVAPGASKRLTRRRPGAGRR